MNIKGNTRSQFTQEIIECAVVNLLKRKGYNSFTVKDICDEAGISRSTFYEHYLDINDFMIKFETKLAKQIDGIFNSTSNFEEEFYRFFTFIKENKVIYKAFLLSHNTSFVAPQMLKKRQEQFRQFSKAKGFSYTEREISYHLYYFGGGLKAVCGHWLQNDCEETVEQIVKILHDEYVNNAKVL